MKAATKWLRARSTSSPARRAPYNCANCSNASRFHAGCEMETRISKISACCMNIRWRPDGSRPYTTWSARMSIRTWIERWRKTYPPRAELVQYGQRSGYTEDEASAVLNRIENAYATVMVRCEKDARYQNDPLLSGIRQAVERPALKAHQALRLG